MESPNNSTVKGEHNPLLGLDLERLEREMQTYHQWLDERADDAYRIAEQARQQGLDHKDRVEIPRASDLAGRTEKLLIEHLDGYEVADDIRALLEQHDRETTSIIIAQSVARGFREKGYDLEKSIDVGLRVGLAVLTEAVLVAPLEGISEVRLLNNVDGSQFVSVHFAGPIRAAGYSTSPRRLDCGHDSARTQRGPLSANGPRSRACERRIWIVSRESAIPPISPRN